MLIPRRPSDAKTGLGPMATITPDRAGQTEVRILSRLLANGGPRMPPALARYVLAIGFNNRDKARMHELAVRHQDGALATAEKDELRAYATAGTLLSLLKSQARRALKRRPAKRSPA
jgi:hypothetical protein